MGSENKFGFLKKKKVLGTLVVVLIVIPAFVGTLAFFQQKNLKDSQVLGANQVEDILDKVGKLIDLPDETPTIATVSDISKLSGQEFFAKAQNGDKVIIFAKAQKAILYRPGTNKIIEVAFYSPPAETPQVSQAAVATPAPTQPVSLRDLQRPSTQPSPSVSQAATSNTNSRVSPAPTTAASPAPAQ